MSPPPPRLAAALRAIDEANRDDPRQVLAGGESRPYELVYAERMTARLQDLYPEASERLQIAARAQHLRRWEIPRSGYAEGRQGYEAWRRACRSHHVAVLSPILARHGFSQEEIARVAALIRKERLKSDPESQALENVVAVVFLEHYIGAFLAKYDRLPEAKRIDILAKTLRKMSAEGHRAALRLDLPGPLRRLIEAALERLSAADRS